MKGILFNIQKFCTQDGPGIRTTVFLKGCPLHCLWCHNPESQSSQKEQMHEPEEAFGYEMSAENVIQEVLEDKAFYDNSGGGVTFSGGEPLFQAEFCLELLKEAKKYGLHVCMETCGFASKEIMLKTAEYVDIYLFDYKETDSHKHKTYTGAYNEPILENLKALDKIGKKMILRCPVIPGYNDCAEHFAGIGRLGNELQNLIEIQIEPYHGFGVEKYKRLGRKYQLTDIDMPEKETIHQWVAEIQKTTQAKVVKA